MVAAATQDYFIVCYSVDHFLDSSITLGKKSQNGKKCQSVICPEMSRSVHNSDIHFYYHRGKKPESISVRLTNQLSSSRITVPTFFK